MDWRFNMIKSVDKNQKKIVDNLREMGFTVIDLHEVGHGCPDIAVGYRGITFFFEIKGRKGRMTPDQIKFKETWKGHYAVIRSTSDAVSIINHKIQEYLG
jgi:Holliday junction resolvase